MHNSVWNVVKKDPSDRVIALMGNPNVGKSTIFNALTGLNQHTGNWPGKTVSVAQGRYCYKGTGYILVDLPGTYSLLSQSEEEAAAISFLKSGQADCVAIVADASCLERNLSLALQVMELHPKPLLCVNLLDEARRHAISVDLSALERELGIPVVGTEAATQKGLDFLKERLRNLADGFLSVHPVPLGVSLDEEVWNQRKSDRASAICAKRAEQIVEQSVSGETKFHLSTIDRLVLGRWTGCACMLALLILVFWLTIQGANRPSAWLQLGFDRLEAFLRYLLSGLPNWLNGLLLDGVYATCSRVVSVMLPPMAIFFPLFTLLEDLGYLPRAAFLMDRWFQRCGSCGKQMLTMTMGFGCNAAGVMGCRIISSPKERLLAIVTNAFVPCNGKFPALLTLIALFFTDHALLGALILTAFVVLGIGGTLLTTKLLSKTILRTQESRFILELPPYRRPQWRKLLVRAFLDRTVFVLGRAASVAAPVGGILWCLQQITVKQTPLLLYLAHGLDPIGQFLGISGVILLAFVLSFPANELWLPSLAMLLSNSNTWTELETVALGELLFQAGWTWKTALCAMILLLFHWPCSTTCLTIKRETGSWKWVILACLLPTLLGLFLSGMASNF